MKNINYRGVRPATIVTVLEGKGTEKEPFEEVEYVICFENIVGISRQTTVGKIIRLSEEEKF